LNPARRYRLEQQNFLFRDGVPRLRARWVIAVEDQSPAVKSSRPLCLRRAIKPSVLDHAARGLQQCIAVRCLDRLVGPVDRQLGASLPRLGFGDRRSRAYESEHGLVQPIIAGEFLCAGRCGDNGAENGEQEDA